MELFERIRYLAEIKEVSLTKISKGIGIPQQTFHQWLKLGSQKNLWEHLPKILELFPDVRPEWLYMGQEPIFIEIDAKTQKLLEKRLEILENEVKYLRARLFAETAAIDPEPGCPRKAAG